MISHQKQRRQFFQQFIFCCVSIGEVYFLLEVDSRSESLLLDCEAERRLSNLRSLASFIRWARSLAYSAASSRFFIARLLFRARRCLLRCRVRGVTRRWILGAFVWAFLPETEMLFLLCYLHDTSFTSSKMIFLDIFREIPKHVSRTFFRNVDLLSS